MNNLTLKNTKAQLLEGYEQNLQELNQLKQKLEANDSELISFENYVRDFQNRLNIHSREWNCLFNEDLPSYWSNTTKWVRTNYQLLRQLPVLQKLSF
jgi:hypothetical protein